MYIYIYIYIYIYTVYIRHMNLHVSITLCALYIVTALIDSAELSVKCMQQIIVDRA